MAKLTPVIAGGVVVAVLALPGSPAAAHENTGGIAAVTVTTTVGVELPVRAPEAGAAGGGQEAPWGPAARQEVKELPGPAGASVAVPAGGPATATRVAGGWMGVREGSASTGNMAAVAVTGMGLLAMLTSAVVARRRTVGRVQPVSAPSP
jgi:hypothetical protein